MNRHLLFAVAFAAAAVTVLFSPIPGGIRPASGCSGAGPITCTTPGWTSASWETNPKGVPTNGAVRVALETTYSCMFGFGSGGTGGSPGTPVTIAVVDDKGTPVPGTPDEEKAPPVKSTFSPVSTAIVTWRPTGPLAPSTTYTLHVAGLAAGKSTDLTFTTGAGPFAPPKPVLKSPTLFVVTSNTSGPTICCSGQGAGGCSTSGKVTCTGQQITPRPSLYAEMDVVEPIAAAKVFLKATLEISVAGGPFSTQPDTSVGLPLTSGQVCARVRGTNTLTGETALSAEWCASVDTLDLASKPNCKAMADVLITCGVTPGGGGAGGKGSGTLSPAKADALQLYADVCGTGTGGTNGQGSGGLGANGGSSGTGGTGESGNGGGSAGAGATGDAGKSGGGEAGGTGSNAGPAAAPANDDGGGGCSVGGSTRSSESSGLAIAVGLLALGAARTRTRRAG